MSNSNQNALINIDLGASVINNLIDKITLAFQWFATPKGSRKDRETAINIYIDELQKDTSLSPLLKAAKISNARKEIKEYCNLQDIIEHATSFAQTYSTYDDAPIDEDWAMFFYDKAKNISREDAKILWGKILAEECAHKGRIPKSLIHILSIISPTEAKLFENLCSFSLNELDANGNISSYTPLITGQANEPLLLKYGLTYEAFQNLEALGLLHYNAVDIRAILDDNFSNTTFGYLYFDSLISIGNLKKEFPQGCVILTQNGKLLSELIVKRKIDGFEEYLRNYYQSQGYSVEISKTK